MPAITLPGDDARGLADLIRSLQDRVSTLETQNRLRDATIDEPGRLMYRDADGVVRYFLGTAEGGGFVQTTFGTDGSLVIGAATASDFDAVATASLTYADLPADPGPSVTVTPGGSGLVLIGLSCEMRQSGARAVTSTGLMTVSVTGGTIVLPSDGNALAYTESAQPADTTPALDHTHAVPGTTPASTTDPAGAHDHTLAATPVRPFRGSRVLLLTGLAQTPITITAKYRVTDAAGPVTFDDRHVFAVPF